MTRSLALTFCTALILCFNLTNLFAQIELEQTIPGVPTQKFLFQLSSKGDTHVLEFNNDGVPDIPFFKTNPQGETFLIIQDGSNPANKWIIPLAAYDLNPNQVSYQLVGFFNIDGIVNQTNLKEIVLGEGRGGGIFNVLAINASTGLVWWDADVTRLLNVADVDNDGCEEIVVSKPSAPQVEIWGGKNK